MSLVPAALLAGCVEPPPVMESSDERIDYIFENEMRRKAVCLEVGRFSMLDHVPAGGSAPEILHPGRFQNRDVARLAMRFARGEGVESDVEIANVEVRPMAGGQVCNAWVSRPVEIEDIALVQFGAPKGLIGAYAFQRTADGWQPVERIKLGFW